MGSIADINVTGKFLDSFEDKYGPVARSLGRLIRPTIVADEGKTFVWCDWSAIEARVLPWLADSPGAERVLDIFRENDKDPDAPDIYMIEASHVYGCDPAKIDKQQRQLGKVAVLSLGFGGSHGALTAMAANYGIHLSGSQREEVINTWRDNNKWARRFWGWFNDQSDYCGLWGAFNMAMLYPGEIFEAGRVAYVYERDYLGGTVFCSLPDGRLLTYPDVKVRKLERELDNGEKEEYLTLSYRRGYGYSGLWYGKLCLGANTLVGTDRGWVPITEVRESDLLWDGEEWVAHDGVVWQGNKLCNTYDGVEMTPDHEVLTHDGWKQAQNTTRHDWAPVRLPYRLESERDARSRRTDLLDRALRLREYDRDDGRRMASQEPEAVSDVVRVRNRRANRRGSADPWHVKAPSVLGLAFDDGPLQATVASGMGALRWAGHSCASKLAQLRAFLERHGPLVPTWVDAGPHRQRRSLLEAELPLGDRANTEREQAQLAAGRHRGAIESYRDTEVDPVLPMEAQPVYDLINAGPRARFVVLGLSGPVIVHNCENVTQAYAASKLRRALVRLDAPMYSEWMPVVAHTHDEIVTMPSDVRADDAEQRLMEVMLKSESWDADLPLAAEASRYEYYSKAA